MSATREPSDLTFGQRAVGYTFNPSGDKAVAEIKRMYAEIIDLMDELRTENPYGKEQARLCSVAITQAQDAQMWAVKAITWKE
jgi:hypothetical protein